MGRPGGFRRVAVLVGVITLTVLVPAATGAASFTVAATPNTGLVDGQTVQVVLTGFTGSNPVIAECLAGVAAGDTSGCTAFTFGSSVSLAVQQQILSPGAGLVDCGAAPSTCVIAAADLSDVTASGIAITPISFAMPAPPSIRVQPASDLADGETVTVGARGFAPNQAAVVQECGPDSATAHCDTAHTLPTTTDASGGFVSPFVAHRFLTTPSGPVDCGIVTCVVTAPPAVTVSTALQFPVPTTKVTVTPNTGLVDGQVVSVTVTPARLFVAECRAGGIGESDCDLSTALSPASFPTPFTVRQHITTSAGTAIDCAAHAGSCVIAAADVDINATLGTAPISFAPPSAPVPASIAATVGTPQSAVVNTAFGMRLEATVRDASGNPVPGVLVTFTAPLSGASGTFAGGVNAATTDANGVATAQEFSANGIVGSYAVTASVAGVVTPASFALTNLANRADLSVQLLAPSSVASGSAITYTVTVTNKGPAPGRNLLAALAAPPELSVTSVSGGGVRFLGLFVWTQPSLGAGQSAIFRVTGQVRAQRGTFLFGIDAGFSRTPDPTLFDNFGFALTRVT